MSLDGFAIHALTEELNRILAGGRIDKIQQPDSTSIVAIVRQNGQNYRLLLSANPQTARIAITDTTRPNPLQPPLFCMVLRKHLEGYKIVSITQEGRDRIVKITCEGYDELGEPATRVLICELMGKHSNLVLINPNTNIILDCCRHLSLDMNQYRQLQPGLSYIAPPPQEKTDITELTDLSLQEAFMEAPSNLSLKKILLNLIAGIGPQTATEIIYRAGLDPDSRIDYLGEYDYSKIWQQIHIMQQMLQTNEYEPTLVEDQRQAVAFAPFSLEQFSHLRSKTYPTMSALLEAFIGRKERSNMLHQMRGDLDRIVGRELDRCRKKLALQEEKVQEGEDAEQFKIYGELLTANLYQLKQGPEATVINYYDPNQAEMTIPMQANLTPNENAQKYFKRYAKAKAGAEQSLIHIALTKDEIDYLEGIQNSLIQAQSTEDLQDVRLELEGAGYVKARLTKQNKKQKKEPVFKPMTVQYKDWQLLIGKNNMQNDYVTMKAARNLDIWFHVKDIHGSHVILRNHQEQREVPKEILDLAAHFAAYFSQARESALVPVDYTLKKHVHKPSGAKPGYVTYDNQKTIYITPDEESIRKLMEQYTV